MTYHCIVTGCAGFIGSSMVDRLLNHGYRVTGIDNFSTGQKKFLSAALLNPKFTLIEEDLLASSSINKVFKEGDVVFHFSANADIRFGKDFPTRDFEQNTIVTSNVLEAMRINQIKKIVFASTGSIYGESNVIPTPEDAPFPIQNSLYGASKMAGESLITAYCETFGFKSWIFRFVSVVGERYSHGHVFDFYKNLKNDASHLYVLGNGRQKKSYIYIQDCLDAIELALKYSENRVNIFNLGVDDVCEINDSINWICKALKVNPNIEYSGGDRGWVGDNPVILLDTNKIRSLGWKPKYSIQQGIFTTVDYLKNNEWIIEARK